MNQWASATHTARRELVLLELKRLVYTWIKIKDKGATFVGRREAGIIQAIIILKL
jgi:hypothetical protein